MRPAKPAWRKNISGRPDVLLASSDAPTTATLWGDNSTRANSAPCNWG
jgi:hypothetical protein